MTDKCIYQTLLLVQSDKVDVGNITECLSASGNIFQLKTEILAKGE